MARFIEIAVQYISSVIAHLGYPGVFVFMMLEAMCLPIPSEIVLVFAGFLVAQGRFTLWGAMVAGLAGALTGATIAYAVGRFGGRPLVERWGKWVLLTPQRLDSVERWFGRYGAAAVVICRWITGLRAVVSLPAGLTRMRYSKFLLCTAIGAGAWVVLAVLIGYFVGEEWRAIVKILERVNRALLIIIVVAAIAAFVGLRVRRPPRKEKEHADDRAR
jgi:membrane protein DedA with SNARE-associated domain